LKALAVFLDPENARYKWLLKPGFRHVFACLNDGTYWTMFDPRDGRPVVQTVEAADYDLRGFFEAQGYTVIETEQGEPIGSLFAVANCVGFVKALLCIRSFAQTPYQLYRYLARPQ